MMPFFFISETEGQTRLEPVRRFSKILGTASIPAAAYLIYNIERNIPDVPNTPIGLAQRVIVGIFLTWICGTAIWMINRD